MRDRVPTYPGRVTLNPVPGQRNTYDMTRADQPVPGYEGTPINKNTLLSDAVAAALGLTGNPTVSDALMATRPKIGDVITTVRDLGSNWLECNGGYTSGGHTELNALLQAQQRPSGIGVVFADATFKGEIATNGTHYATIISNKVYYTNNPALPLSEWTNYAVTFSGTAATSIGNIIYVNNRWVIGCIVSSAAKTGYTTNITSSAWTLNAATIALDVSAIPNVVYGNGYYIAWNTRVTNYVYYTNSFPSSTAWSSSQIGFGSFFMSGLKFENGYFIGWAGSTANYCTTPSSASWSVNSSVSGSLLFWVKDSWYGGNQLKKMSSISSALGTASAYTNVQNAYYDTTMNKYVIKSTNSSPANLVIYLSDTLTAIGDTVTVDTLVAPVSYNGLLTRVGDYVRAGDYLFTGTLGYELPNITVDGAKAYIKAED